MDSNTFSSIVKKDIKNTINILHTKTYEEWIISRNKTIPLYTDDTNLHKFISNNLTLYTSILAELSEKHEILKSISYKEFIDILYKCMTVDIVLISSDEEESEEEDENYIYL